MGKSTTKSSDVVYFVMRCKVKHREAEELHRTDAVISELHLTKLLSVTIALTSHSE